MKRIAATALLAMGLLQVAAASQDSPGKPDEQADSSAAAQAAGEQARAAAARELKAAANEFKVVTIEPAQWSDSSLGCRKPNAMYQQVVSSGYVVVLEREGKRHQVNVAGSRAVLCDVATRITGTVRAPPLIGRPLVGTYMASLKVLPVGVKATAIVGKALLPLRTEVEM